MGRQKGRRSPLIFQLPPPNRRVTVLVASMYLLRSKAPHLSLSPRNKIAKQRFQMGRKTGLRQAQAAYSQ